MALAITRDEQDGKTVIKVQGEIDLYSSPELRAAVTSVPRRRGGSIAVDLSGVPYMDSSGVATLVEGYRNATESGATFALIAPSVAVRKVLQLSRLDTIFTIQD